MDFPDRGNDMSPYLDEESTTTLDEAVATLGSLRGLSGWLGDAGTELHLLVSLHRRIHARLPDAVAEARDQEYTWAEIAERLGTTRTGAWRSYGRPGKRGHTRPTTD